MEEIKEISRKISHQCNFFELTDNNFNGIINVIT